MPTVNTTVETICKPLTQTFGGADNNVTGPAGLQSGGTNLETLKLPFVPIS